MWAPPRCCSIENAILSLTKQILASPGTPAQYCCADLATAALGAGKHVYVEKPLADTPGKVEQVVAAQE